MMNTIVAPHCPTCEEHERRLSRYSIDPGFGVPVSAKVHDQVAELATSEIRVDMYLGDIDSLKCLNSATGHQPRTDELFKPALQIRASDALIHGKYDSGDQFLYVFPAGQGRAAVERIQTELALAPMTAAEQARYVRAVCEKKYGLWLGRVRAFLGLHAVPAHPSITFVGYEDIAASELAIVAAVADRRLFEMKAGT